MQIALRGRNVTAFLGLGLLTLALFSSWSTWRFVRGAQRVDGRVFFSDGSSTLIAECETAQGRKNYILVRRPPLGPFLVGKAISILTNPSVAHDPLHPEHYRLIPVTARVASNVYLWAWPALLFALALPITGLWFLAWLQPRRFRVSTRLHFGTRL